MPRAQEQLSSRPPLERMMYIHRQIQEGKYPNSITLAKDIEVCTRTIKRDIDFMRYRLNLPIEYDTNRFGYYYTRPVEQFPGLQLTEAEIFALLVAHKVINEYRGTPFAGPLETAFRRITGQLDQKTRYTLGNLEQALSFRPLGPEESDLQKFQILTQALKERQVLKFRYKNLGATTYRQRQVRPYHLACVEHHWYLFGFDEDRKDMRTFALTRLQSPELTGRYFTPPARFDVNDYLRGSFGVFKGHDDYEVVIEFDAWATDLIRGRRWHPSQQLIELPGGASQLRFTLNSLEEVESWVLSFGSHAVVRRPKALAQRICKIAQEITGHYKTE